MALTFEILEVFEKVNEIVVMNIRKRRNVKHKRQYNDFLQCIDIPKLILLTRPILAISFNINSS